MFALELGTGEIELCVSPFDQKCYYVILLQIML